MLKVKAVLEAGKELEVEKLSVVTWNEKREVKKDGMTVKFRPLWEWLQGELKKEATCAKIAQVQNEGGRQVKI